MDSRFRQDTAGAYLIGCTFKYEVLGIYKPHKLHLDKRLLLLDCIDSFLMETQDMGLVFDVPFSPHIHGITSQDIQNSRGRYNV